MSVVGPAASLRRTKATYGRCCSTPISFTAAGPSCPYRVQAGFPASPLPTYPPTYPPTFLPTSFFSSPPFIASLHSPLLNPPPAAPPAGPSRQSAGPLPAGGGSGPGRQAPSIDAAIRCDKLRLAATDCGRCRQRPPGPGLGCHLPTTLLPSSLTPFLPPISPSPPPCPSSLDFFVYHVCEMRCTIPTPTAAVLQ